jgi:hypothetical protein
MPSSGGPRSGLLIPGGILSIAAGVSQIIPSGVLIVDFVVSYPHCMKLLNLLFVPFFVGSLRHRILWGSGPIPADMNYVPIRWAIIGGFIIVLGIIGIVGGVSALRRKSFGASLAGAICTIPSGILGILAVIFVALGKREFGRRGEGNGI